jgi:DNA repair protein RecN (Recombination protein N)
MLLELRIENYAVIDNLVISFAPGLNLLTGETGAGKSILVDALALLLGEKASAEIIRHGAERAVIAGVFTTLEKSAAGVLEANGLDGNGEELILRREVVAGSKGRVFVNNQPATVGVLKQLAPLLASIHAQKESMFAFAFDASARLALLDSFAGVDLQPVAGAFAAWQQLRQRITELERNEQDRMRLVDLWSFQKKEIEGAHLEAGEDQQLETEKRVLVNAEKIYGAATAAYDELYDGSNSATAQMRAAARHLEELSRFDEKFQAMTATVDSARITVEDLSAALRDYAAGIDASPERLATLEERLALLDRLKRKYGESLAQIIDYGHEVTRKLDEIENRDELLKQLRHDLDAAASAYLSAARELSRRRFEAARKLEKLTEGEINDLAMKARFKVEVSGSDEAANWTAGGFNQVAYLISANPGEPLGPVEDIASGGELSRVILALKVAVGSRLVAGAESRQPRTNSQPARTLVFDEIDTGIGGRAAEAVGRKLKSLAATAQVLCVTHLPQIASFADHHYVVEKHESGGRTRTTVRRLEGAERTEEIARMLSGATITEQAMKHAAEILNGK